MSNGFSPMWSRPARNRVLMALARHPGAMSVRELARLAHVSPSTALRVSDELVEDGLLVRRRMTGKTKAGWTREPWHLLELKKGEARRIQLEYGTVRSTAEQLAYLGQLDAPVWVISRVELTRIGITRRVPTFVALPRTWLHRFKIPVPVAVFEEARPLELAVDHLPDLELLIALLKIDALAAGQLYGMLKLTKKDRVRLLRRMRVEDVRTAAEAARIPLDLRRKW